MAKVNSRYVKSKYKYVYGYTSTSSKSSDIYWRVRVNTGTKSFLNEKQAALVVDEYLIKQGKEPVNILKRK